MSMTVNSAAGRSTGDVEIDEWGTDPDALAMQNAYRCERSVNSCRIPAPGFNGGERRIDPDNMRAVPVFSP